MFVDNTVQNPEYKSVDESVCISPGATCVGQNHIYPTNIKGFLGRNTSLISLLVQSRYAHQPAVSGGYTQMFFTLIITTINNLLINKKIYSLTIKL